MGIPELCIRRPVLATVLSLLVILTGLVSYSRLTVREYPNIDEPVVTVSTAYRGASAEIVESQITQPLEESIAGIEGIKVVSSISREGSSQITVEFQLTVDPDAAASDVRDRVGRVRGRLPDEIEEPVIAKVEADANPIIFMPINSDRHNEIEVTDIADRIVKTRLQTLPGVAEVRLLGEREYAMRVWVDRARLAAYGLTVQDVEDGLRAQNLNVPAGRIESTDREFTVEADTDLLEPEQFDQIVLKDVNGYLVRLRDVARTEVGALDERRVARFMGRLSVTVGVVKTATANPLDVTKAVRAALPEIRAELPEGVEVDAAYDSTIFIAESIEQVYTTIAEAIVLVVLVIFFFLRNVRATLIPIVTIPVSLIGACAIMFALGFSINTLTLLAFVLAIGLVVDDAIVVLENIYRNIEEGRSPFEGAIRGAGEIQFAVIAMTLTLVAVYVPVAFAEGRTGRLFTEFAITLAGAVLVSGFVALTLTPMMCSRLLRHDAKHGWFFRVIENGLNGLTRAYLATLRLALKGWVIVVLIAVLVAGANGLLLMNLKSELAPVEDRGSIFTAGIAPEGATVEYGERYALQIQDIIAAIPEVEAYIVIVGFPQVTNIVSFARMKPWSERTRKQQDIVAEIAPKMFFGIPGIMAFPTNPPSLGQSFNSAPVRFVLQTSGSYAELNEASEALLEAARANPNLMNVDSDLKLSKPQLDVTMNRDKIADLGISVGTVARTLETFLGGRQVTRFERDGKQYDVVVQLADEDRREPSDMTSIYVRGRGDTMVQLSNILDVAETVAPKELNHFNQSRAATISAQLAPGYTIGEALAWFDAAAARLLPSDIRIDYAGQSREFREASTTLMFTFVLALGFIFLVLAAQFESFIDPVIIMVAVPLSIAGALAALTLTGGTLNVYSQLGLITLIGLITKHGILIVEFANQAQERGVAKVDAVLEAARLRLRPILMTTGAMVLGALPLAIATGAGAESRNQIGWVIVGGMTVGTFLTVFVVPTFYMLMARDRSRRRTVGAAGARPVAHPAE